jgi:cobalt-zinc-cadmium efflux system protein
MKPGKRLFTTILLNIGITAAEIVGGLMTGFLALLADAIHNLSDVTALILAYMGERAAARPATKKSTYGFKRVEVMTAFISAVALVVIAVYIFYEAYQRFLQPQIIKNPAVLLTIAGIGFVGNILSVWILHGSRHQSLNIRTAFLHMFYDTVSSLAVIISAVIILETDWYYLDPILAVIIGLMILWSSFNVLKEATMIFMEAVPRGINFDEVAAAVSAHPQVCNVHHLHIWSLSSNIIALSCHISVAQGDYNQSPEIIRSLSETLQRKFAIEHCTIQAEMETCADINSFSDPLKGNDNYV